MLFKNLNLREDLISALNSLGYVNPTEIQSIVIPKALRGENVIVQSATGTGKTHSFLIPILNSLEFNNYIQAIIVLPTKELAQQTYLFASQFKDFFPELKVKLFTSGIDASRSKKKIEDNCQIVVATPGRLNSLLKNANIDFSYLKTIVLDEADMLMDEGFVSNIDSILAIKKDVQIEVFSATITNKVAHFIKKYVSPEYIIPSDSKINTSSTVKHFFINTKHEDTNRLVISFIEIKRPYLLMIFANSKEKAKKTYEFLQKNGYKCGFLSGDLKQRERKSMLRRINNDEYPIIVCSDIASRGLDIIDVSDVLNLDIPNNIEYYFHRAGRTGRNGKEGNSYIFYDSDSVKQCEKLLNLGIQAEFLKFSNDALVSDISFSRKKKTKKAIPDELKKDIQKAIIENKGTKVKPGYKKKVRKEIEKVKKKHKREIIKKDIRRQMEERYRNEK